MTLFRLRTDGGSLAIEKQDVLARSHYLPAFSPAGDKVAVSGENGKIVIGDLARE